MELTPHIKATLGTFQLRYLNQIRSRTIASHDIYFGDLGYAFIVLRDAGMLDVNDEGRGRINKKGLDALIELRMQILPSSAITMPPMPS